MDNQGNHQDNRHSPTHYAGEAPGKGKAVASLVLGIISIILPIPVLGAVVGIVGIVLASLSKREGYTGGIRTAGLVCSIIGTVGGLIWTILLLVGIALFAQLAEIFFWHHAFLW